MIIPPMLAAFILGCYFYLDYSRERDYNKNVVALATIVSVLMYSTFRRIEYEKNAMAVAGSNTVLDVVFVTDDAGKCRWC